MNDQPSRLVAFHQYAAPVAMLVLGFGAVVLIAFTGMALLKGTLGGSEFVAIAAQFFGLVGLAYGATSAKRETRASDPAPTGTGNGAATATVTVASGGTSA